MKKGVFRVTEKAKLGRYNMISIYHKIIGQIKIAWNKFQTVSIRLKHLIPLLVLGWGIYTFIAPPSFKIEYVELYFSHDYQCINTNNIPKFDWNNIQTEDDEKDNLSFMLYYVIKNYNKIAGDCLRPYLTVCAHGSKEKYILKTEFWKLGKENSSQNIYYDDLKKVFMTKTITEKECKFSPRIYHVNEFGMIEGFEIFNVSREQNSPLYNFIINNKKKLYFVVTGAPYKDKIVELNIKK